MIIAFEYCFNGSQKWIGNPLDEHWKCTGKALKMHWKRFYKNYAVGHFFIKETQFLIIADFLKDSDHEVTLIIVFEYCFDGSQKWIINALDMHWKCTGKALKMHWKSTEKVFTKIMLLSIFH